MDNKLRHYLFLNDKINSLKNDIHGSMRQNIIMHDILNSLQKNHDI
jgi:hypothetical protein